jgi:glycosyltransferase involved in cell wall biosynthesis
MKNISVTAIMPAYNEEGAICAAVQEIQHSILDLVPDSELVVINDGSKDATGALLDQLAETDSRLRIVHQPNGGHGRAVLRGLAEARGEWVFLLDSDRQIPLESFEDLWENRTRYQALMGVRSRRHDPRLRLILTRVVRQILRVLMGVRLRDANVPFKLLHHTVWEKAEGLISEDCLVPSLFLAIFVGRSGIPFCEVEVPHRERTTGEVSIKRWKLAKFCARAFFQLLDFRRNMNRIH